MKIRIQYMYEHGGSTMLEMLLSSDNLSDFMIVFSFLGTAAQDGGTRTGNGCSGEVGGYVIQLHVT